MVESFNNIREKCRTLVDSPQDPALFQALFDASLEILDREGRDKWRVNRSNGGSSYLHFSAREEGHNASFEIQHNPHFRGDGLYISGGNLTSERPHHDEYESVSLHTRRRHLGLFGAKTPRSVRFSGDGHVYDYRHKKFTNDDINGFLDLIGSIGSNPTEGNSDLEEFCRSTRDYVRVNGIGNGYNFKRDGLRLWMLYIPEKDNAVSASISLENGESRGNLWLIKRPTGFRIASLGYHEGDNHLRIDARDV